MSDEKTSAPAIPMMSELDCARVLAPLASPNTRIHVHEAMKRIKAGERNVAIAHFELARIGR